MAQVQTERGVQEDSREEVYSCRGTEENRGGLDTERGVEQSSEIRGAETFSEPGRISGEQNRGKFNGEEADSDLPWDAEKGHDEQLEADRGVEQSGSGEHKGEKPHYQQEDGDPIGTSLGSLDVQDRRDEQLGRDRGGQKVRSYTESDREKTDISQESTVPIGTNLGSRDVFDGNSMDNRLGSSMDNQLENDFGMTKRSMERKPEDNNLPIVQNSEPSHVGFKTEYAREFGRDHVDTNQTHSARLEREPVVSQEGVDSRDSVSGKKEAGSAHQSHPRVNYGGLPEPTRPAGAILLTDQRYTAPDDITVPREPVKTGVKHETANTVDSEQYAANNSDNAQAETANVNGATAVYGDEHKEHAVEEPRAETEFMKQMAHTSPSPRDHHETQYSDSPLFEANNENVISPGSVRAQKMASDVNKETSRSFTSEMQDGLVATYNPKTSEDRIHAADSPAQVDDVGSRDHSEVSSPQSDNMYGSEETADVGSVDHHEVLSPETDIVYGSEETADVEHTPRSVDDLKHGLVAPHNPKISEDAVHALDSPADGDAVGPRDHHEVPSPVTDTVYGSEETANVEHNPRNLDDTPELENNGRNVETAETTFKPDGAAALGHNNLDETAYHPDETAGTAETAAHSSDETRKQQPKPSPLETANIPNEATEQQPTSSPTTPTTPSYFSRIKGLFASSDGQKPSTTT